MPKKFSDSPVKPEAAIYITISTLLVAQEMLRMHITDGDTGSLERTLTLSQAIDGSFDEITCWSPNMGLEPFEAVIKALNKAMRMYSKRNNRAGKIHER